MPWSKVTHVAIHHTAGATPKTHTQCESQAASIERDHAKKYHDDRGKGAIAYNYLVCPHGTVVAGRGLSSSNDANGCRKANESMVAICIIGYAPHMTPTIEKTVRTLIAKAEERFGRALKVIPHRDVDCASTACPGQPLAAWCRTYQREEVSREDEVTAEQMAELKNTIAKEAAWAVAALAKAVLGRETPSRLSGTYERVVDEAIAKAKAEGR